MKTRSTVQVVLTFVTILGVGTSLQADQSATVTEAVNQVTHGTSASGKSAPAVKGTPVHDGEYLETGAKSRAEMLLPSTSITRLGSETIFNYTADSNTVDLHEGDILFCKPKSAPKLNIMTAAVTAGITGTTGFVSIRGEGNKKTYVLGLIEGHATAHADEHPFLLGPGDILEFKPGQKPFTFSYDVPRFVKSSSLLHKFSSQLPNQGAIDKELAEYADDVSRGFIVPPSNAIDYSGDIPLLSTVAYSSAQNAQSGGQSSKSSTPPPPPPPSSPRGSGNYNGSGSPFGTSPGH